MASNNAPSKISDFSNYISELAYNINIEFQSSNLHIYHQSKRIRSLRCPRVATHDIRDNQFDNNIHKIIFKVHRACRDFYGVVGLRKLCRQILPVYTCALDTGQNYSN